MKTVAFKNENKKEVTKALEKVKQGTTVRFPNISYEDALKENLFYMVIGVGGKEGRVKLVSLSACEIIERDGDRHVIEHESELRVKSN